MPFRERAMAKAWTGDRHRAMVVNAIGDCKHFRLDAGARGGSNYGPQTAGRKAGRLERQSDVVFIKTGRWPVSFCACSKRRSGLPGSKDRRAVFERPERELAGQRPFCARASDWRADRDQAGLAPRLQSVRPVCPVREHWKGMVAMLTKESQNGLEEGAELSRRSLLAGAAAAAAIILPLPKGSALARYPLPRPSNEFCLLLTLRGRSQRLLPYSFHASKGDAEDYHGYHRTGQVRYEMHPFIPMAADARFFVLEIEWDLASCSHLTMRRVRDVRRGDKFWDLWAEAREEMPLPTSLIDLLPGISGMASYTDEGDCGPLTRADALKEAARLNDELLDDGYKLGMAWNVVVELGEQPLPPDLNVELEANGIGSWEYTAKRPIRLVRPTADELALYPVAFESEVAHA